jgi:hypothetical protein
MLMAIHATLHTTIIPTFPEYFAAMATPIESHVRSLLPSMGNVMFKNYIVFVDFIRLL